MPRFVSFQMPSTCLLNCSIVMFSWIDLFELPLARTQQEIKIMTQKAVTHWQNTSRPVIVSVISLLVWMTSRITPKSNLVYWSTQLFKRSQTPNWFSASNRLLSNSQYIFNGAIIMHATIKEASVIKKAQPRIPLPFANYANLHGRVSMITSEVIEQPNVALIGLI